MKGRATTAVLSLTLALLLIIPGTWVANGVQTDFIRPLKPSWGWYDALVVEILILAPLYAGVAFLVYRVNRSKAFGITTLAGFVCSFVLVVSTSAYIAEIEISFLYLESLLIVYGPSLLAIPVFAAVAWEMSRRENAT